ncbi:MAG: DUF3301 domain-containing protein, partial [Clostridia bacterium]|nr:DUF3301 domain-containing protein [Deltaproteobacteria bacterium]
MEILTLLGFVSLAWFWVDSMRAREAATRAGKRICEQEGVQF